MTKHAYARGWLVVSAAAVALIAEPTLAQTPAAAPKIDAADTAWMIAATALVLMMSLPGLALFYAGMVRKKNVLATMAQTLAAVALGSILWMVVGYSLAFTGEGALIGTFDRVLLTGMGLDAINPAAKTIPESVFMSYQMTFAAITVALVAGSVADRMRFSAFLWFIVGWVLLVYVPLAHMIWGGGFLTLSDKGGVLDFAGGLVVHLNAGVAGLVAAYVLGARRGYGSENLSPFDLSLAVIGTGLLWVGWMGFNGGSALAAGARAGHAIVATHLAACAGVMTWMLLEWWDRGKPSVLGMISGAVAGLGTITPASGFVAPWHGLVIGVIAGAICYWACIKLKQKLGYDDSLDVFGVHGIGGATGAILVGIFAVAAIGEKPGLLEGNPDQLVTQFYGLAVTLVWSGFLTLIILKVINFFVPLRVRDEDERMGLDVTLHGEALQ